MNYAQLIKHYEQLLEACGEEVLKEIRKKSNLPILILTAFSDEEYKIDAFTNLVDGYVEKPFSLPVLKARIDSISNFSNELAKNLLTASFDIIPNL